MNETLKHYEEKIIKPYGGIGMLIVNVAMYLISTAGIVFSSILLEQSPVLYGILMAVFIIVMLIACFMSAGFKIVPPNEAVVLVLFGNYFGTINKDGFYWTNPFAVGYNPATSGLMSKRISLKAITLVNDKQKVNDLDGNPVEIGVIVIWRIINTAKAAFNVDNYVVFISTQADSAIRQVARLYPYDITDDDEKSLRGSSQEISQELKKELQERVDIAGIEIMEVRINHLAYAQEIAAAMLQRQQATAVVAARQKIVEGAVGMVEMAIQKLNEHEVVKLDDEKKATMVSNLMVVLCGNRDAQPVINSGSLY